MYEPRLTKINSHAVSPVARGAIALRSSKTFEAGDQFVRQTQANCLRFRKGPSFFAYTVIVMHDAIFIKLMVESSCTNDVCDQPDNLLTTPRPFTQ